ncbi:Spermatogenesis-associated protein 21 [Labeo rohita]|uniref:Spermatogenesis-associated protein 21 n=1 Tax=Labeo rohita TaxID=84645 RepID=A0ABQ8LXU3_LABRO|nr:Spermatogenesis-associated protein 21 [Labeo rohita]
MPDSCHVTALTKISPKEEGGGGYSTKAPADAELGPRLKRPVWRILMSTRAAGIPVVSTHSSPVPLSTALPMMAVAILSVWAAHCGPEASSVHVCAPEAFPVHEFAPLPPEVAAPTEEPPEVATLTAEPPKGVAPIHELTACPVTAMEACSTAWAWPSIPPSVPPSLHHPPGLFGVCLGWVLCLGIWSCPWGGGMSRNINALGFIHNSPSVDLLITI